MKKLFLLVFAVVLLSCSGDDSNNSDSYYFNPPQWIQGSWSNGISGFAFKEHDFCSTTSSTTVCIDSYLKTSASTISVSTEEPVKSETEYKFSYTMGGNTQSYRFRKVSDTKIEYVNPNPEQPNAILTRQ